MPSVNPQILKWARETAGMSPEAAASKLGINDTRKLSGAVRVNALEEGQTEPTEAILRKMSKVYRRPLLAFYLPAPPRADESSHDFRTLPQRSSRDEPVIAALLRDVKTRQSLVRAMLEEEDHPKLDFVGAMAGSRSTSDVLGSIVETTGISLQEFRSLKTPELAFSYLRQKLEAIGVFVVLLGNLGTHHTNIDVSAFRGIALSDPLAPFIIINDQDAKPAWSFTLLHEASHIWLGESGISAFASELESERFCNEVASAFLLPNEELVELSVPPLSSTAAISAYISRFASPRNLSMTMVAYRLYSSGKLSFDQWTTLADHFRAEWRRQKESEKEARKAKETEGGPSYYMVRRHRLGKALLDAAHRGITEGTLSATKAGKILGVAPRSVYPLLNSANGRAA